MASNMLDIVTHIQMVTWVPPILDWVNLKQVFGHANLLPLNSIYSHANFGQWDHLFCTKWLDTKIKIDQASKMKNKPCWFGTYSWLLAVGMAHAHLGVTKQICQLSIQVKCTISIFYLNNYFIDYCLDIHGYISLLKYHDNTHIPMWNTNILVNTFFFQNK